MRNSSDISDFLKEENNSTTTYIDNFLQENGILELNKEDQIRETAKLIAKFPRWEGRTIEELLITKCFGTCTAKHLALQACYDKLEIKCHQVMSTFRREDQGIIFPEKLQKILDEGGRDHGHNFIQVEKDTGEKIDVDITWNSKLKEYGFKTFPENWDWSSSFVGAKINQRRDECDMKKKKIELIESLSPEIRERREYFLKLFIDWITWINKTENK